ncbi:MAG TPA: NAD(P)H-binding protein [Cyclobacteriaceae bacterium]
MKITVIGSLGNISKPLTQKLIQANHQVTLISSSSDKSEAIKALGASPAIGHVNDVHFLTKAFTGADAVYTMIPPHFGAPDFKAYADQIGEVYRQAIKAANVKQVINLSSIGSHLSSGTGVITGIHRAEQQLNKLEEVNIKHLRSAFFFTNYYNDINMIKHMNIIGSNYSAERKMILVHPNDIAEVAFQEIIKPFTGKSVRYVASDQRTTSEIAGILGKAIGNPELKWVEFADEQALAGMLQAGLPEDIAKNYIEMGSAVRSGKLFEDYELNKPALGKTKLEDFAKDFAAKFLN